MYNILRVQNSCLESTFQSCYFVYVFNYTKHNYESYDHRILSDMEKWGWYKDLETTILLESW